MTFLCLFALQILMSVGSMRHCVALMASVRTDWAPSNASVTKAIRSPRMVKAVWVCVGVLYMYIKMCKCFIVYLHVK